MSDERAPASVWRAVEAQKKFDALLAAAEFAPQFIEADGRTFVLTIMPEDVPAREVLARGGPLDEEDEV